MIKKTKLDAALCNYDEDCGEITYGHLIPAVKQSAKAKTKGRDKMMLSGSFDLNNNNQSMVISRIA